MFDKNRLSKEVRLRSRPSFQTVFDERKRIFGKYHSIFYRANSLNYSRLGVIVSKRNVRLAVMRNKIKRIAKERFRLLQHELDALDIIVIAHKQAGSATNQELHQCLSKLFKKLISH